MLNGSPAYYRNNLSQECQISEANLDKGFQLFHPIIACIFDIYDADEVGQSGFVISNFQSF